jgi:hypothetical protein
MLLILDASVLIAFYSKNERTTRNCYMNWREIRFQAIIDECKKDPILGVKVYEYLNKNIEIKLEKIEGNPVEYLLTRAGKIEAQKTLVDEKSGEK